MGEITLHLPDQLIERAQQAGLLNTETIAEVLSLALGDEASGVPPLPIRSIRSFFDQIHDAVFLLDLNGRHFAANERAVDMFGYTVEEIYTKSALELSGEPEATDNVMGRLLAGEHVPMLKRWMRHKSGALFPVEVTAQLVRDSEGKPAYIQSIVRDITEHIQSEQRIRDAESLLRTIINAVPNHIFARDGEGRYVIANEAAAQIVGSTVDEIIGKTDFDLGVPAAAQIRAEDATCCVWASRGRSSKMSSSTPEVNDTCTAPRKSRSNFPARTSTPCCVCRPTSRHSNKCRLICMKRCGRPTRWRPSASA